MNPLQKIFIDKFREFESYIESSNAYYYYYDDEDSISEITEDRMEHFSELVDFSPLAEIAAKGELTSEIFSFQMEKSVLAGVKAALEQSIHRNSWFKAKTEWKPLDQLLTLFRLKELKSVGITRRGGRGKSKSFDVSSLAATFFGKQILRGLEMGRRRTLDDKELEVLKAECAKLKLTLPEIIEPTTTERFFSDSSSSEADAQSEDSPVV